MLFIDDVHWQALQLHTTGRACKHEQLADPSRHIGVVDNDEYEVITMTTAGMTTSK